MAEAMASAEPTPPAASGRELSGSAMGTEGTPLPDGTLSGALTSSPQSFGLAAEANRETGEEGTGRAELQGGGDREQSTSRSLDKTDIALSTQLQLEQLDALQQHVQKQLLEGVSSAAGLAPSADEAANLQVDGEAGAPFGVAEGCGGASEVGAVEGEEACREALAAPKADLTESGIEDKDEVCGPHFSRKGKGWGDDARLGSALSGGTAVEEEGENSSSSSLGFSASSPGGRDGNGDDGNSLLPATSSDADVPGTHEDRLRLLVLQQESMMKQTPGGELPASLEVAGGGRVTPSASDQTFSSLQFSEESQSPQKAGPLPSLLTGKRTRRSGQAPTAATDSAHLSASLSPGGDGETGKIGPSALLFCGEEDPQSSLSTPQGADGRGQSTEATPSSGTHASGDRKAKREDHEPMKTRRLARAAAQAAAAMAAAAAGATDGQGEAAAVKAEGKEFSGYLASPESLASQALAQSSAPLANLAGSHPAGLYLDEASALSGLVPGVGKGGMPVPVPGAECAPAMNAALLPVISTGVLSGPGAPGVPSLLTSGRLSHPGAAGAQAPALAGANAVPQGACAGGAGEYERSDLLMRPGVSYYGGRQAWVAEIKYGGRRRFKVFSVAKYGYEGAKQMAVDTRERWEEAREAGELDQLMMSSQRHQCPVQSGVKGVYYDTARKGWRVVVTLNCRQMSKFFLASKFGNAEAKRLAIECRQMWLDAIQNGRADDVFEKARKLVSFKTKGVNNGANANAGHNGACAGAAGGLPHTAPVGSSSAVCGAAGPHAPAAGGLLASRFAASGPGSAGSPHQGVGAGVGGELSHSSSVLLAAAGGGAAGAPGGLQGPSSGLLNSSLSSCLGKFGATPPGTGLSADGTSSSCLFSNAAGTPSRNLRDASNELLLAAAAANASSAHAGTAALLSGLPGGAVGVPVGAGAGPNGAVSGDGTSSLAAAAAAFLSPSSLTSVPRGLRGDTPASRGNTPGGSPTEESGGGPQAGAAGVHPAGTTPGGRPSPAFGLASFAAAAGAPGAGACATEGGAAGSGAAGNAAGAALLAVASQQGFDPKLLQQQQLAEQQLVLQQWGEAAAAVAGGVGIPQTLFSSGCADGENANGTMRDPVAAANQHQQLQLQLLQELNRGASLPPLLDVLWGPSVAGTGAVAAPGDREAGGNQGTEGACGAENDLVTLQPGAAREEAAGGNQSSLLAMGLGGQEESGATGEGAGAQNGCGLSAPVLSLLLQQQGLHHQQLAAAAAAAARGCAPQPGAGALCGFNRDGNMVVLGNPVAGGAPGCLLSGAASGDSAATDKRGPNQVGGALGNAMGAMSGHLAGGTLLGAAGAARPGANVAAPATGATGSKRRRTQQGAAAVGLQGHTGGPGAAGSGATGVGGSKRHQRQSKDAVSSGILAGSGGSAVPGADCAGAKPLGAAAVGTGSENSTCDVRGVYLDTRNNAWAATMGVHGRNVKKSFAVAKHGYETALQLAIHARRQLERIYWGSSPGDEQDAALLGLSNRGNAGAVAGAAANSTPAAGALSSLASPHQGAPASAVPQPLLHAQQPLPALQGLCWPTPGGITQAGAPGVCGRPEDEMTASMAALRGAILDPAALSRLSGEDAASAEAAARTAVAAGSLLYGTPFGSALPTGLAASPVVAPPSNSAEGTGELASSGDLRGVVGGARVRTGGVAATEESQEGAGVARPGAVAGMLAGGAGDNLSPALGMAGATAGACSGGLPGGPTLLGSGLEGRDASLNMANLIASTSGSSPSGGLFVRDALAALLLQLDPQQRMALLQGDMNSLNSLQAAFLQNSQFFTPSCAPDANQLFVGANATPNGPLGAAAPEPCSPSLLLGNAEGSAGVGCGAVGLAAGVTEETLREKEAMLAAGGDQGVGQVKASGASENEQKEEQEGRAATDLKEGAFSFGAGKEEIQGAKTEEDAGKEKEPSGEALNLGSIPTGNTAVTPVEPTGVEMAEQQPTAAEAGDGLNGGVEAGEDAKGSEAGKPETIQTAPPAQEQ
ncbi:unnamed protein product [Neospora caninum Liverpool]|uniref:AP2 domain transcription factor AP2X-7 n=1 Tax=Neospora caninum (strain Liverpool) TaxID=572307 RepID=F0VL11_NEOCL|nr:uncharacterized protein NCLIV_051890 [Neospora caninum Liverpool]CBZ54763.1 unnamed protein product [Neospora caninum Liverpool]CEL69480.1 TPA: AP2 domain transcription factor AP2X-7 [Neospora caninum Liverpool]|eukprot:XP_003884791.1 uncharacterized protein NCLIV_051890 [Neospora caninum Liverpool]